MRRDWLKNRPPRPWPKPTPKSIWGSLNLDVDFETRKTPEVVTKDVTLRVPVRFIKKMMRRGLFTDRHPQEADEREIADTMLRFTEENLCRGIRAKSYE